MACRQSARAADVSAECRHHRRRTNVESAVRSRSRASGTDRAISRGGRLLGQIEEYFIEAGRGRHLRLRRRDRALRGATEDEVYVARQRQGRQGAVRYMGGKFRSTYLAERVRHLAANKQAWRGLPDQVREWLSMQAPLSRVPGPRELVVETFPRGGKTYPGLLSVRG